ncbi:(2Fe-2S)-binding protein [Streptomyces sp. NPDC052077]|uniref:(2Fe-2S)-binding protein n=1 Tax=Streptomyces sp. NPDC052077 TaxID=3154757 RepID=UPI00342C3563
MDLDPGLDALRPFGGYFALRTAPPPSRLPALARAWSPAPAGEPAEPSSREGDPLGFRVRRVAAALRASEIRVAASVAHQGLAARLWSVALGCAALYGALPDPRSPLLRWDPGAAAPDDLWLTGIEPLPGDAATLAEAVLDAQIVPLTTAVHARYRVSTGLLRGNAASALAGAAREFGRLARAQGRPDAAERARTLAAALFAHPLLTGTGDLTALPARPGVPPDTAFRRLSCCLYYRVPGGGVCGDCCFPRAPRSARPPGPAGDLPAG